jgi:hypothetical protein
VEVDHGAAVDVDVDVDADDADVDDVSVMLMRKTKTIARRVDTGSCVAYHSLGV